MAEIIARFCCVVVTGGTGSFGRAFVRLLLSQPDGPVVRVLSRDEYKQLRMAEEFAEHVGDRGTNRLRLILGDVRENNLEPFVGADAVVHAAALKQVPMLEYNPWQAVLTNVVGTHNVVAAARACGVGRFVTVASDKGCNPANTYGGCKFLAERLTVQEGNLGGRMKACVVRYGNVLGSRGSVLETWRRQVEAEGRITLTHPDMTRFWITLERGAEFTLRCLAGTQGGETFIPKMPSMRVRDLAEAAFPGVPVEVTGVRPGEKLHEELVAEHEAGRTLDGGDRYVVLPTCREWAADYRGLGEPVDDGFRYRSDENCEWLSVDEMREMVAKWR